MPQVDDVWFLRPFTGLYSKPFLIIIAVLDMASLNFRRQRQRGVTYADFGSENPGGGGVTAGSRNPGITSVSLEYRPSRS
jgi:hypothetical protein